MIFVYGAYGVTGRRVVTLLSKMDIEYAVAGRSKDKLEKLLNEIKGNKPTKYFVSSPENLSSVVTGKFNLVINTAGPFSDIGENVVDFAYKINANYIDCSGEALWTKRLVEEHSERFASRGLFISSGFGWETVAGEIITKKLIQEVGNEVRGKKIYLVYSAEFRMSPGTLQSSINVIREGAIRWEKGVWVFAKPFEKKFIFRHEDRTFTATNISSSDVINVPISLGDISKEIDFEVLFATSRTYLLPFAKLVARLVKNKQLSNLVKAILDKFPEPKGDSPVLTIALLLDGESEIKRSYIISENPYEITARIISFFTKSFSEKRPRAKGYKTPTELIDFPKDMFPLKN